MTLNILDVAGNLQLTQGMLDNFVKEHADIVSRITTSTGKAPDMAGKLKAQQDAGRLDIDLVLTGTDGLSAGISQNLFTRMTPDFDSRLSNMKNYTDPAMKMQELAQGYGVELVQYPSGPLLAYNPAKVPNPPTTAEELLAWAKANPGRFQYAVPKNSGPGRTLLMGLPYILGDVDPKSPTTGWDKTWAYLKELGQYTGPYEAGTTNTMTNLGKGTVDMVASTTGWDINPRVLGTVPNTTKITTLKGFHWVTDAQYAVVPKGVNSDKLSAILSLLQDMLTPQQQAIAFDKGYFYPGPAVKGVTLDMAPQASQDAIARFGRPEYDALIANNPQESSLPAEQQVIAFSKWDLEIGAAKK
ncbi:extracellular solute-binding protein [Micromonospora sp. NPDC005220]|uniref:extracellular solute-binding protein n=1 Tax=Micromonospora sp. NPDC005220 TaxID=3155589 RepID=UPI0033AC32C6